MVGNEVINGAASKESMKNTLLKVLNKEKWRKALNLILIYFIIYMKLLK
jgi:hypothetical protein